MSVILQLLAVAAVIAAMIMLRMMISRQSMRQTLADKAGKDCEEKECFGGCHGFRPEAEGPQRTEPGVN